MALVELRLGAIEATQKVYAITNDVWKSFSEDLGTRWNNEPLFGVLASVALTFPATMHAAVAQLGEDLHGDTDEVFIRIKRL